MLKLLEEGRKEFNQLQFKSFVQRHGLYDRKDHISTAWNKIKNDDYVPYAMNGGSKLEVKNIKCECGSSFYATSLANTEGECPSCGRQLIDFGGDESGPTVV